MRAIEITHPHVIQITIDPVQFSEFERLTQDSKTVRLLRCHDSSPEVWTLHVACASAAVAERMVDGWA